MSGRPRRRKRALVKARCRASQKLIRQGPLGLKVAQLAPSARDAAGAFAFAAVVVVARSADEGGGLIADMTELGKPGGYACDRLRAEAWRAVDDLGAPRERGIGLDLAGDRGVERAQFGPHRFEDRGESPGDKSRRAMFALLLDPLFDVLHGRPGLNQGVDLRARRIIRLGRGVRKGLGEPGDRLGVDWIVLGQPPGCFGEMADAFGIDDPDREAGRPQGFRPTALIAAARLPDRPSDPVGAQATQ